MSAAAPAADHSRPIVFPPVIPMSGFLLGLALERVLPVDAWISPAMRTGMRGAGAVLFVVGAAGFAWMVRTMRKARTPIHNAKTPTCLVETGPFARTRNPMYLFGSTAYAGLALLNLHPWSLALLPFVVTLVHYGVVLREEEYLDRRFGEAYAAYKKRVPRWL